MLNGLKGRSGYVVRRGLRIVERNVIGQELDEGFGVLEIKVDDKNVCFRKEKGAEV